MVRNLSRLAAKLYRAYNEVRCQSQGSREKVQFGGDPPWKDTNRRP